jgi:ubiquinone/menaquinone biosynthesis C-methylase UbiE
MVKSAERRAGHRRTPNVAFARMGAETLDLPDAGFDVALCGLGLMYFPEPELALREMRRVLRPGGRLSVAVWGARASCGWAAVFPIVDAEVASEVCPLFFRLGTAETLAHACAEAGFADVVQQRLATTLTYPGGEEACDAVFVGGPAALAWSRFDGEVRARVRARYLAAIASWRIPTGYALPGEFVIVSARAPS